MEDLLDLANVSISRPRGKQYAVLFLESDVEVRGGRGGVP